MRKKFRKFMCGLLITGLLVENQSLYNGLGLKSVLASSISENLKREAEYVVSSEAGLKTAFNNNKKNIKISGSFSIVGEAEISGQMKPLQIPAGTIITGDGSASITCRTPIQIMGDGVEIHDIEFVFNSSDALNSVPHREIFLAGHSLLLDNVSTYLEGAGGLTGGFGGTEKELLPTVYAGGYKNTNIGNKAALTIKNANPKTYFKDIYMSHDASSGERTAYRGEASLNIDEDTKVRGTIAAENSKADILFDGGQYDVIAIKKIDGNSATTLKITDGTVECDDISNTGSVILDRNGCLKAGAGVQNFNNISLKNNGCLDLSSVTSETKINNFIGSNDSAGEEKGNLVVSKRGVVTIAGKTEGVTRFHIQNRFLASAYSGEFTYIKSADGNDRNFVLSQADINNKLAFVCKNGEWTMYFNYDTDATPSQSPTPTASASTKPSTSPTASASIKPSTSPTASASIKPSTSPTASASIRPSQSPTLTASASVKPSASPTVSASIKPSTSPTASASIRPSQSPTPTAGASVKPSQSPTPGASASVQPDTSPTPTASASVKPSAPHRHEFIKKIIKKATCKSKGECVWKCSCGVHYSESIPKTDHILKDKVTKASVGKKGYISTVCTMCKKVFKTKIIYAPQKIQLSKKAYIYDGKKKKPLVKVLDSKNKVINKKYYSVYYSSNIKAGIAHVTIKFKNIYSGSLKASYKIYPKK